MFRYKYVSIKYANSGITKHTWQTYEIFYRYYLRRSQNSSYRKKLILPKLHTFLVKLTPYKVFGQLTVVDQLIEREFNEVNSSITEEIRLTLLWSLFVRSLVILEIDKKIIHYNYGSISALILFYLLIM